MASDFAGAFQRARARLDRTFGEPVVVHPMQAGEYFRAAASGPSYEAAAIVDLADEIWRAAGVADAGKSEVVVMQPQAEFALSAFGPGRPQVKAGDEIELVSREGAPRWRVQDARDDGVSALVCHLVRVGAP